MLYRWVEPKYRGSFYAGRMSYILFRNDGGSGRGVTLMTREYTSDAQDIGPVENGNIVMAELISCMKPGDHGIRHVATLSLCRPPRAWIAIRRTVTVERLEK